MSAPRVPCAQCGLPARRVADSEPAFCCVGCALAHRLGARPTGPGSLGSPDTIGPEGDPDDLNGSLAARGSPDTLLARVLVSAVLATGIMVFSLATYGEFLPAAGGAEFDSEAAVALRGLYRLGALALSTPVMLLLGLPLIDAVLRTRRYLSIESLVLVGTASAYLASAWKTFTGGGAVYYETATMVLVLASLGRWLDVRARVRSSHALSSVVGNAKRRVTRLGGDPGEERIDPLRLAIGDRVRLRPGDIVPRDGTVERGASFCDTSSLSGEDVPRSVGPGERVLGGWSLVDGALDVRVEAARGESVQDEIDRVLAAALATPPRLVRVADRVAAGFLPFVALLFVATIVVRSRAAGLERGLFDGLSVALISCPCALGLATPLAFWAALGRAWRDGVLVRGGDVFERLARARRVYFDKTGTLTTGELALTRVVLAGASPVTGAKRRALERRALGIAARLESASEHPIGRALVRAAEAQGLERGVPDAFRALAGVGVEGVVDGELFALRRAAAADCDAASPSVDNDARGAPADAPPSGVLTRVALYTAARAPAASPLSVAAASSAAALGRGDGIPPGAASVERAEAAASGPTAPAAFECIATFELASHVRAGSSAMLRALERRGLELGVLTGDGQGPARALEAELGVRVQAELLPADKVALIEAAGREGTVFVGDGLNDAGALGAADVGIAVSSAAPKSLAVADVQLLGASPSALPVLFELADRALGTARLNLFWSFAYNAVGLYLAATGRLTPIFAAFAMVGSSTFVVLLSSRLGADPERER